MKVCVISGGGAIGGYLATKLARAGNQVTVVARGSHVKRNSAIWAYASHGRRAKANHRQGESSRKNERCRNSRRCDPSG
ncbi:ketopantoate reductase family protein [Polynucleobacter necessarius]|uniref:ketopantoate reductase family protein n=1 Tax=Polynucleobacter necessarius TaxID=576610 RepID=UPI0022B258BA|nr:2-dehydropantoate 2-reductase N-terminal domain-containing protein [Polynucleobacter necessarius]